MEKVRCLNCGGEHLMKLEYGMPDDAMVARIEAGEILHGGCIVADLTQSLYCLDCDTRFDPISTPQFISSLKQIHFAHNGNSLVILLEHIDENNIILSVIQGSQTTKINDPDVFIKLAHCGLEFWSPQGYRENKDAGQWRLELITKDDSRNLEIQGGNQSAPYAFALWLKFLEDLGVRG